MNQQRELLLNTILYLVSRRRKPTTIMALSKLLFLFDSEHTRQTGLPAIGLKYHAYQFGPLPVSFWEEVRDGDVPDDFNGSLGLHQISGSPYPEFKALVEPDMDVFTPRQQGILAELIKTYGNCPASLLVNKTHEPGSPWKRAYADKGEKSEIPYEYSLDPYSDIPAKLATDKINTFIMAMDRFNLKPTR